MLDRPALSRFLAAGLLAGLTACAAPPPAPAPATAGAPAAGLGRGVPYEVVGSDVAIEVYRDGPLAGLGHNHVIGSTALAGRIALQRPLAGSSFELTLPVASLTVDEPARLAAAGPDFPDGLSADEKEATRRNMLSPPVLDGERFPAVTVQSLDADGADGTLVVRTRVSVAGHASEMLVPVTIAVEGETLHASGRLTLTHAQLGLTPFSALMGALRVADQLRVAWRLEARRAPADAS